MSMVSEAQAVLGKDYNYFVANANGVTFNSGLWCVDFVNWCAKKAGVTLATTTSSSGTLKNAYQNAGKLKTGTSGIKSGDIVFTNTTANATTPAHTGIATSGEYTKNGATVVDTINGNWSGVVGTSTMGATSNFVLWYATP